MVFFVLLLMICFLFHCQERMKNGLPPITPPKVEDERPLSRGVSVTNSVTGGASTISLRPLEARRAGSTGTTGGVVKVTDPRLLLPARGPLTPPTGLEMTWTLSWWPL